jgi:2-dehydro-3-deoxy-D-arabinonate dehydratase
VTPTGARTDGLHAPRRVARTTEGWGFDDGSGLRRLRHPLAELLTGAPLEATGDALGGELLAPIDNQEVWAAGVTYQRSLQARTEESHEPDVYDRVYLADRPELFFKSVADRVVGPGGTGHIRSDSGWDVPEPEVVLVLDARGELFGYTVGDDLSSRSIEGDNPLYLPQAKVYEGACILGPHIVLAADVSPPFDVDLVIERGGSVAYRGATSTARMHRDFETLASWLFRGLRFPHGAFLMTGTGVVPDGTLHDGDRVRITVSGIGTLEHEVATWTC